MQAVNASYNPYTGERIIGVNIQFELIDVDAAGQAIASTNGAKPFSTLSLFGNVHSPGKIMTMEDELVQTDGTWDVMPDDMAVPYWSTGISGQDGTFAENPMITVELSAPASSIGFSLEFDEAAQCWPSEIIVNAYNANGDLIATETFENTTYLAAIDMPVSNYTKVEFVFSKTKDPYRLIKLYNIIFGIIQIFDPSTLVSATFKFGASIDCSSIPSRELVFTFDNKDLKYNFMNPSGIYSYLQDGQQITAKLTVNSQPISMGQHYFTTATAKDDALTAQIQANDKIYQLDKETYENGESGSWTFNEAIAALLGDAQTDIPTDIGTRTVGKAIPKGTTNREALRLLAQAAMCTCWIGRNNEYVFRDLVASDSVDTLTADNMVSLAAIEVMEPCDCVQLKVRDEFSAFQTEHVYTSGTGTNIKTYSNPCAINGQAVADWLLAANQRRLKFTPTNRGNPALEIGDTVSIETAFGETATAVIINQELTYDGGLEARTEAISG